MRKGDRGRSQAKIIFALRRLVYHCSWPNSFFFPPIGKLQQKTTNWDEFFSHWEEMIGAHVRRGGGEWEHWGADLYHLTRWCGGTVDKPVISCSQDHRAAATWLITITNNVKHRADHTHTHTEACVCACMGSHKPTYLWLHCALGESCCSRVQWTGIRDVLLLLLWEKTPKYKDVGKGKK